MTLIIPLITLVTTAQALTTIAQKFSTTDPCNDRHSCSSCLTKSFCSWCVNKSYCTKNSCGNDNVIYPESVQALMTGDKFCPRVAETNSAMVLKSGEKHTIEVKTTQLYIFMAFTKWRCRINVNGKEITVDATPVLDIAFCDPVEIKNDSDAAYIDGSVSVLWGDNKQFDGALSFKVCRCDLDSRCVACKK